MGKVPYPPSLQSLKRANVLQHHNTFLFTKLIISPSESKLTTPGIILLLARILRLCQIGEIDEAGRLNWWKDPHVFLFCASNLKTLRHCETILLVDVQSYNDLYNENLFNGWRASLTIQAMSALFYVRFKSVFWGSMILKHTLFFTSLLLLPWFNVNVYGQTSVSRLAGACECVHVPLSFVASLSSPAFCAASASCQTGFRQRYKLQCDSKSFQDFPWNSLTLNVWFKQTLPSLPIRRRQTSETGRPVGVAMCLQL